MRGLSIQLLGALHVTLDDRAATDFGYDKVRALLGYLAAEQEQPHRREALAGLLWPDQSEQAAESSLRNALSRLRRVLGDHRVDPKYLIATREVIQFNPHSPHWLDLRRSTELIDTIRTHHHRRIEACPACTDRLLEAAGLYRGEFMQGFSLPENDFFEDWLRLQRDTLRQQELEALTQLAATYLWRGEPEKALTYTQKQISLDPCREAAYAQGMKAYADLGQRAEACQLYEQCKQVLEQELDLEPMEETTRLYEQVKYGLYQPATAHGVRLNNLPTQLTSFVGREHELSEIHSLLEDPACRLLSLVGPGGVGKTRLAIAAAAQLSDNFPNGACFVSLVGVSSSDGIVPAILQALGDKSTAGDLKKHLLDFLRDKELVLILDNFEHLLKGAGLTTEILQNAPGVLLLVTSRQRLGMQAEWVFEVSGLSYPTNKDTHELGSFEAVKLFTQRLHQLKPHHSLVQDDLVSAAHICQVVEGLPLAIELAAAAVIQKPIAQVASAIESGKDDLKSAWKDVPERHRSIRAVFDHSYKMLSQDEQATFTSLGVFRAGFTAEAAEQVAGATPAIMDALVDHSLVRFDANQRMYTLHELVRQYARDRLEVSQQMNLELHQRHCQFYIGALEHWDTTLYWSQMAVAMKEMDLQQPDIQAAWDWACQQHDLEAIQRAYRPILQYYFFRQRLSEAEQACLQALKIIEGLESASSATKLLEVIMLYVHFDIYYDQHIGFKNDQDSKRWVRFLQLPCELEQAGVDLGDWKPKFIYERSAWETDIQKKLHLAQEAVDLARTLADDDSLGLTLNSLALILQDAGKSQEAQKACRETLAIWRKRGQPFHIMGALSWLSEIAAHLGNLDEALQCAEECAQMEFSLGNAVNTIDGLQVLGKACYYNRKWNDASKYYADSLPFIRELGDRDRQCKTLASLGNIKLFSGYYDEARVMAEESCSIATDINGVVRLPLGNFTKGSIALIQENLDQAKAFFEKEAVIYDPDWQPALVEQVSCAWSIALIRAGDCEKAYEKFLVALRTAESRHSYPGLSYVLPATALYLATKGKLEEAMELYGLITEKTIYGNTPWLEDVVGKQIKQLASNLPPELVEATLERGRKLDLFETAKSMLEEFENR